MLESPGSPFSPFNPGNPAGPGCPGRPAIPWLPLIPGGPVQNVRCKFYKHKQTLQWFREITQIIPIHQLNQKEPTVSLVDFEYLMCCLFLFKKLKQLSKISQLFHDTSMISFFILNLRKSKHLLLLPRYNLTLESSETESLFQQPF